MAVTINTGTTAPSTVLISGDDVNANAVQIYVFEQTAAGTPSSSNTVLLGNVTTTSTSGSFPTDKNGDNFSLPVVLSGSTSYLLGATGAAGDIFFVGSNGNLIAFGTANNDILIQPPL